MTALRVGGLRRAAQLALALVCIIATSSASAAITCSSVTVTAITTAYDPNVPANNDSTGTFTATCTRNLAGDPATVTYYLGASTGGGSFFGGSRHVTLGANNYSYNLYRDAAFSLPWLDNADANRIAVTFNFVGPAPSTASVSGAFYMRVPGSQTPAGPPGNYTDNLNVRLRNPPGADPTAALPISVRTQTWCTVTVPPGNVSFTYTSFQGASSNAGTTYGVRCTTTTPYTMALDGTLPYTYSLLGLTYTLSLPAGATGSGLTQTHTINGSIAAGQAGACATGVCNGTQTRTLTISW